MSLAKSAWLGRMAEMAAAATVLVTASPSLAQPAAAPFTAGVRYDVASRVVGTIAPDPDGAGPLKHAATRITYDSAGRPVTIETGELAAWQPESVAPAAWAGFTVFSQVQTTYDAKDNKLTERLVSGGTTYTLTQYSYDAVGRLECTAQRMNPAAFASPPTSACTLGTAGSDGSDRIERNVYDAAGQLLRVQKAYATSLQQDYVTYTYTPNGKVGSVKDAGGNLATFTFDGFDWLSRWTFPDKVTKGVANTADYEAYTYDANGNRLTLRKRDGAIIGYTYDALNRVMVKDLPGGTASDVYFGYDLRGLQLFARFGSIAGAGLTNAYDGFGRLASSSNNLSGTALTLASLHDGDGNRVRLTHPDCTYFDYDYDGLDRQTVTRENGGVTVATISYDAQGRRSGASRGAVPSTYGYDAVSRLTTLADDLVASSDDVTTTFAYNAASQIVSRTRSNDGYAFTGYTNVSRSYLVNGLNQYTAAGGVPFTYDANGNLTGDGTSTFGYDVENRLTSKSGGLSLSYDPAGRLWQTAGGPGGTTRYLYDGDELVAEYDGASTLLRRYVHGSRSDDPALWYEGSGLASRRSLQSDHQGSIVSVADAAGAKITINSYDEYGIPGAANLGRFQYTGQAWLPDLGMYYYKARIYSPKLGRFLQTDPIGYDDQINLYAYVANDPNNGTDPTGQNCVSNGDGTQTCTIVVTAPAPAVVVVAAGAAIWNSAYRGYRSLRDLGGRVFNNDSGQTAQEGSDKEWEDLAEGSQVGPDGQTEKSGGKEQAEKDFEGLNGAEVGAERANGARVKVLPDGTRVVLRPSGDGRWTIERQSPRGRKPDAGSGRRIRYNR